MPPFSAAEYRCAAGRYHIVIENPDGLCVGRCRVELDGSLVPDGAILLEGEARDHRVRVVIAAAN